MTDYTPVPEYNPGDVLTAADYNRDVGDNLENHEARISAIEPRVQVGLDADKPASPEVGDVYVATDKGIIWRCMTDGAWNAWVPWVDESIHRFDLTRYKTLVVGGFGGNTAVATADWNSSFYARSGNGQNMLKGSYLNGPGPDQWYHVFNFEFVQRNGSGNLTQIAIPYASGGGVLGWYYRHRYSGSWSQWYRLAEFDQVLSNPSGANRLTWASGDTSVSANQWKTYTASWYNSFTMLRGFSATLGSDGDEYGLKFTQFALLSASATTVSMRAMSEGVGTARLRAIGIGE